MKLFEIYEKDNGTEVIYCGFFRQYFPDVFDVDEELAYGLMEIGNRFPDAAYCCRCGEYSPEGLDNNGDCPGCAGW